MIKNAKKFLVESDIDADDLRMISRGIKNDGLHFGNKEYEILGNLISSKLKKM